MELDTGGAPMMSLEGRRNFLRGRFRQSDGLAMYPPGAQDAFAELCTNCGDCATACPEGIIVKTGSAHPIVDFTRGACTFCGECSAACPSGALLAENITLWPWRATIQTNCLSFQGITCRACEDACEPRAIRFRLMTAGRAIPEIDTGQCSGCGECAFTCPAQAVRFEHVDHAEKEIVQ
ncbi:ferredoxin-type protein NapF [Aliishimia ponticola]|nr:ferredoxin-type protein NapF [Aliishimia ponticola]